LENQGTFRFRCRKGINTLKKIQNEELTVKSINYKFPNFKTTVNVGDYSYDFLDNMAQVLDTVNSQESERSGL